MIGQPDPLHARAVLVDTLSSALRRGGNALGSAPGLLKQILADEGWRDFITQRDERVHHDRFADFVTEPPLRGLGANLDLVRRIIGDDTEALDLFDCAVQQPHGGKRDVLTLAPDTNPRGTSKEYALRRLRKDAPDMHARVLAGEVTPHAAMVEAGLRPPTFTIRVTDPDSIADTLRRRLPPDVLAEVSRRLAS